MFEWLRQEIETIKTKRFHIVEGAPDTALRAAIEGSEVPLPRSYKEFVFQFGKARLYRQLSYYVVGVLAPPVKEQSWHKEELYCIGHYQSSSAYFKAALLRGEEE